MSKSMQLDLNTSKPLSTMSSSINLIKSYLLSQSQNEKGKAANIDLYELAYGDPGGTILPRT